MAKTYDSQCLWLAEAFLRDEPSLNTSENAHLLACEIQEAIETGIDYLRTKGEPHGLSQSEIRSGETAP